MYVVTFDLKPHMQSYKSNIATTAHNNNYTVPTADQLKLLKHNQDNKTLNNWESIHVLLKKTNNLITDQKQLHSNINQILEYINFQELQAGRFNNT